jgi:hypothetical protein
MAPSILLKANLQRCIHGCPGLRGIRGGRGEVVKLLLMAMGFFRGTMKMSLKKFIVIMVLQIHENTRIPMQ